MSTNIAKPVKVAIIGASGTYGKGILARAEEIGVEAVVITRSSHKFKDVKPTTTVVEAQLDEEEKLKKAFAGCDGVISALGDPEFQDYSAFPAKWSRELGQMKRMASDETRFYYSGLAQAVLLDRVMPGWKDRALTDGVWLEDLLAEPLADATGASADRNPEPR